MKRRIPILMGLLLGLWPLLHGQSPFTMIADGNHSYREIVERGTVYFDSLRAVNGGQLSHDEKVYGRWKAFWASRVCYRGAPDGGDFAGSYAYLTQLLTGGIAPCQSSFGAYPWAHVGPKSMATMHMGVVGSVARDPVDRNTIYAGTNHSGVWKTTNGGTDWRCMTDGIPMPFMPVTDVQVDPLDHRIVYAATGVTLHSNVRFGNGIFKSTDAGATWTHIGPRPIAYQGGGRSEISVIRFHPGYASNGVILAAGGKDIFRSTDRGATWSQVLGNQQVGMLTGPGRFVDMEILPQNPSFVLASTHWDCPSDVPCPIPVGAELQLSTDAGLTWRCVTCAGAPIPFSERIAIDVTQAQPSRFYIARHDMADGNRTKLEYATVNGTATGMDIHYIGRIGAMIGYPMAAFEVSESNPDSLYIGGVYLFKFSFPNPSYGGRSIFGSLEPILTTMHPDVRDIDLEYFASSGDDNLLIGCDGGVSTSENSGLNFRSLNGSGLSTNQYYGFDFKPKSGDIVAGAQDNHNQLFDGATWRTRFGGDGGWILVDPHNEQDVLFVINEGWHYTPYGMDSAGFVNMKFLGFGGSIGFKTDIHVALDPFVPRRLWYGDFLGLEYIDASMNNPVSPGLVFQKPIPDERHHLMDIAMSPAAQGTMYWSYNEPLWNEPLLQGMLYRSRDGCQTFTDISANLRHPIGNGTAFRFFFVSDLEVDPEDPDHLFAGMSGYDWDSSSNRAVNRVYESYDGGDSWIDISHGLGPWPVNTLHFQNGGSGVIYAGTDHGVYRFNPGMRRWQCFNQGLPPMRTTRILVDHCRKRLLLSTFGRGVWEAPLPPAGPHHVSTSQEWKAGTVRAFANDVIVDAGATLTIRGEVQFAPGARLIVSRGAKLRLLGGTLTSPCGLWQGIDVAGHPNRNQFVASNGYAPFQGIVEIVNGKVEHARTGICTALHDTQGQVYWNTLGGIVRCTGARFENCIRGVLMLSYPRTNLSFFRDCRFETTAPLHEGAGPSTGLAMWNVQGIPVVGCTFRTAAGAYPVESQRGVGILAIDATYLLDWRCTQQNGNGCSGGVPTRFEGLTYGLHQENSNPLRSPSIRHCQFVGNAYAGAKLRNAHFAVIDDNGFEPGTGLFSTGLYLESCSRYSLQGNSFTDTQGGHPDRYGLIVHAGGNDFNQVYNNTFTGLPYAISAQEDNEGPVAKDGLIMRCNDFLDCDFSIMALGTLIGAGVGDAQGWLTVNNPEFSLVRNRYFSNCFGVNENKFHLSHPAQYDIDHTCNSNAECQPLPQPACSDFNVIVTPTPVSLIKGLHCQPIGGYQELPDPKIVVSTTRLANATSALEEAVDGGNTAQVVEFIAQTTNPAQLRSGLLSHSPYLSDDALKAMLDKAPSLPHATIRDVLVANSPLSAEVKAKVSGMSLSQGIRNQIAAAQVGISPRALLENELFTARNELQFWKDEKIRRTLRDTLNPHAHDSLEAALDDLGYSDCYRKSALCFCGSITVVDSAMAGQPLCATAPAFEQLAADLRSLAKACCMLDDSTAGATREQAFASLPAVFPQAEAALAQLIDWRSAETHLLPTVTLQKVEDEARSDSKESPRIRIYPNPAHDRFFLEFEGSDKAGYELLVLDMAGRQLMRMDVLPDTPNSVVFGRVPNGLYLWRLYRDGKPWKSGKIQVN